MMITMKMKTKYLFTSAGDFRGSTLSDAFALLRWPLAMCIVAVHWFRWARITAVHSFEPDSSIYPCAVGMTKFAAAFLSDNGVASFFFISGYLFFAGGEMTRRRYLDKVNKRVYTLFVPFVLWNLLMVAYEALPFMPGLHEHFPMLQGKEFEMTLTEFVCGMGIYGYPHNANLWFIRELMCFVLLVPLLLPLIRRRAVWLVTALAVFSLLAPLTDVPYLRDVSWGLTFFAAGACLAVGKVDFSRVVKGRGMIAFSLFLMLGVAYLCFVDGHPYVAEVVKFLSLPLLIVSAVALASWLAEKKGMRANKFLMSATFFVFAFHPMLLTHMSVWLNRIVRPETDAAITLTHFVGYLLLFPVMLLIYKLLAAFAPRLTGLLTGRRNTVARRSSAQAV